MSSSTMQIEAPGGESSAESAHPVSRASFGDLPILSDFGGPRAESIRALRTHIVAQHLNLGRRALAVCAASAEVGCSFVAANLAVALSQIGLNTLLMDANLRQRPGVEAFIPTRTERVDGLVQALSAVDSQDISRCIQHNVLPNLSIMYSGGLAANAQEILSDDRFGEVIATCLRDFDVTIVDTPPANRFADARRISTVLGYNLVVARKDASLIADVKTLIDELQIDHSRTIGTVLNEA